MKKTIAIILSVLMSAAVLCSCGGDSSGGKSDNGNTVSAQENNKAASDEKKDGDTAASAKLPGSYEIAVTDPHLFISTPDWNAESYGRGFALNENGNKDYAIVVACGYEDNESSLKDTFSTVYNDAFNGILMQNYRAKYAEFTPETTEDAMLINGVAALRFEGMQSADDYGTELKCPVYGYCFKHNGIPFIVAYIVMNESSADDAKRAEMKGYVDEMINTVRETK